MAKLLRILPLGRADILRRYKRGWGNLLEVYRLLADHCAIYYNSALTPQVRERGPMTIEISAETPGDVAAIHAVTIAAFLNAPHTSHTEQFIVDALRAAGQLTVSLVAKMGGIVVGHVAISPVSISDGATDWYGLGPISVAPQHQRHGIGSRLMREALSVLRKRGASGCVLLGEPEYYGRFGFAVVPHLNLPDVPLEYFQALSFGASSPRGTVSYHAAFNDTSTSGRAVQAAYLNDGELG